MRKYCVFLLLLAILATSRLAAQQTPFWVIDTAVVYSTQDTTRHLYAFNGTGKMTSDLTQKLNGEGWQDSLRETRTYDGEGNPTSFLSELCADGQWICLARYANVYDPNGKMLSNQFEIYSNGQWTIQYREIWTYNADGNPASYLHQGATWQWVHYDGVYAQDTSGDYRYAFTYDEPTHVTLRIAEQCSRGQWDTVGRNTYTRAASGNVTSQLSEHRHGGPWDSTSRYTVVYGVKGKPTLYSRENRYDVGWIGSSRITYTYDANGNMISSSNERGEGYPDWKWVNGYYRETYSYDGAGLLTSNLSEYYQNGQWLSYHRSTCMYDARKNLFSRLEEYKGSGDWANAGRDSYTYVASGNLLSYRHDAWRDSSWLPTDGLLSLRDSAGNTYGFTGSIIKFAARTFVTEALTQNDRAPQVYSLSQNYPNPFNPTTTIKYALPKSSHVTLTVHDILGRQLTVLVNERKEAGDHEVTLNGSNLASGVYFYRMQAGSFVSVKKGILLK